MVNAISTSLSGLLAQSKKLSVAASNIANADTKGSLDKMDPNQPYLALTSYTKANGGGVDVAVVLRTPATVQIYDPDAPFANEDGMVAMPNVNLDEEVITAKMAEQAYTANAKVMGTLNRLHDTLIDALDEKA